VDKLKETHSQRHDATLSEIYELIFHNETLVRSELKVLQDLVQKKLKKRILTGFFEHKRSSCVEALEQAEI
jgi:hypothetical protein